MRRECLDFLIPINERHLRRMLREWVGHYNSGRPHSSLGPGIPDRGQSSVERRKGDGRAVKNLEVIASPILGGLHHEYSWEQPAA